MVLPLHPRTRGALERYGIAKDARGELRIIDLVGYLDVVMLEKNARLIVTESGGVQKEAFFYRVPCVTLRDETEWVELVELGWNRVVPPQSAQVVCDGILSALDTKGQEATPYGLGDASYQIVKYLREWRRCDG